MLATQTAERVARLRAMFSERGIDALLVSQPESRYYLSGYSGHDQPPRDSAGYLLVTSQRLFLLTDPRTTEQAGSEASAYEIVEYRNGVTSVLQALVADQALRRIGFEDFHLPYHLTEQIRGELGNQVELVETAGLVDELRVTKDTAEMDIMRAAVAISDACIDHLMGWLRPGLTEREVAWEAESYMRTHGAEALAFDSIVAAGSNGAMPHAVPSDRRIAAGESIIIDMGARFQHYNSDITRTVCLGTPPDWLEEIYRTVLAAQERAEALIGAGLTGKEADAIARDAISNAGYGERFAHSLGHGIGLEVHEPPRLSMYSEDELRPGMVFSIEPGIYLPGQGAVRIEDLAWLGPSGLEVLTRAPKGPNLLRL